MAQIQRWIRNGKRLVVIPRFQRVTQLHDMANRIVHQFNGVNPTRRVAGMTGLPQTRTTLEICPLCARIGCNDVGSPMIAQSGRNAVVLEK